MKCNRCGMEMNLIQQPNGQKVGFCPNPNCQNQMIINEKQSKLGIVAFVLSLLCVLSPIGLLLGIIDLTANKGKGKKGLSIASVVIGAIFTLFIVFALFSDSDDTQTDTNKVEQQQQQKPSNTNKPQKESESEVDDGYVHLGESFTYDDVKVTIDSYDPDYQDYKSYNKPENDNKIIRIGVTFENVGKSGTIYVGNEDFNLYADNVSYDSSILVGDDQVYMTELSVGRKVSSSIYYEIPIDSDSVELEYSRLFMKNPIVIKLQ